jgi:hypothetical protein
MIVPVGPETTLISNAMRAALGLVAGPDTSAARITNPDGSFELYFAGKNINNDTGTFRFHAASDFSTVTNDPMAPVLRPASEQPNPGPIPNAAGGFDRDYAGGGTPFQCPGPGGKLLYFYHGENYTDPYCLTTYACCSIGWSGIGIAYWDTAQAKFVKDGQIIGANLPNQWYGTAASPINLITPPGIPSGMAFYNPTDGYLYLYYTDRTTNPEYAGAPWKCNSSNCITVARALATTVCANAGQGGLHTEWSKYYHGSFSSPALNADGSGGEFSPLSPAPGGGQPTAIKLSNGVWVMAAVYLTGIIVRTSLDGIAWSARQWVVQRVPPPTPVAYYPYLYEAGPGTVGMTYTRVKRTAKGKTNWSFAELDLQMLQLLPTSTPTLTPTPLPCVGDCNDDREVGVDELLTMVSIALDGADLALCTAGDANHDGQITIDEIITAVANMLYGCPPAGAR